MGLLVAVATALPLASGCAAGIIVPAIAIGVSADGDGSDGVPAAPTGPDLIFVSGSAPKTGHVDGASLVLDDRADGAIEFQVANQGDDVAPSFRVSFFLSMDKTFDAGDLKFRETTVSGGTAALPGVPRGGAFIGVSGNAEGVTLSSTPAPGDYFVVGRVNDPDPIGELDAGNNAFFLPGSVRVHAADPAGQPTAALDLIFPEVRAPTQALAGEPVLLGLVVLGMGGPVPSGTTLVADVLLVGSGGSAVTVSSDQAIPLGAAAAGVPQVATVPVTMPSDAQLAAFALPARLRFAIDVKSTGVAEGANNAFNNEAFAGNATLVYGSTDVVVPAPGATLPDFARDGSLPEVLTPTGARFAGSSQLAAGQQRILSFEIPAAQVTPEQSQALIVVSSPAFDPVVELLGSTGESLAASDDGRGVGRSALLYQKLDAFLPGGRVHYLVVSSFEEDGAGAFEVQISVNARGAQDSAVVSPVVLNSPLDLMGDGTYAELQPIPVPFAFPQEEVEFLFTIPARTRAAVQLAPGVLIDEQGVSFVAVNPAGDLDDVPSTISVADDLSVVDIRSAMGASEVVLGSGVHLLTLRSADAPDPNASFSLTFKLSFESEAAAQSKGTAP